MLQGPTTTRFDTSLRTVDRSGSPLHERPGPSEAPAKEPDRVPIAYFTDAEERRAIVEVLGALDDKIELNRCMSETLELQSLTQ